MRPSSTSRPVGLQALANIGALIVRIGFLLKGVYKGYYKGLKIGFYDKGALMVLIGFWGPLYYNYNKEPPPKKNGFWSLLMTQPATLAKAGRSRFCIGVPADVLILFGGVATWEFPKLEVQNPKP